MIDHSIKSTNTIDNEQESEGSEVYTKALEGLNTLFENCTFLNKTPEIQKKYVVNKIYDLTKDENLSFAGLLYLLLSNHDIKDNQKAYNIDEINNIENLNKIDNIEKFDSNETKKMINILKGLSNKLSDFYLINKKSKKNKNTDVSFSKIDKNYVDYSDLNRVINLDDTTDVEEIIMMIFVTMSEEQDIRALVIELVCRLSFLKNIKQCKYWHNKLTDKPLKTNGKNVNKKLTLKMYVAFETFKIFVPIANRLGIWSIKWELEDLAFKQLQRDIYSQIATLLNQKREEREDDMKYYVSKLEKIIQNDENIKNEKLSVSGRPKNIYSTYAKMKQLYSYENNVSNWKISFQDFNIFLNQELLKQENNNFQRLFEGVHDLFGIRIICDSEETCYQILSIIRRNFKKESTLLRKYGELADYIVAPKSNGYQSIHLVVHAPKQEDEPAEVNKKIEIQIRTDKMHKEAEYGIAAHWKYKELGYSHSTDKEDYVFNILKEFIDNNGIHAAKELIDYLEKEQVEFGSKIYIFTPEKNIISLKKDSTPVDFAYRVHTDIGNQCVGARVNERIVPLSTPLQNGDIVEIITQKNSHPSLDWLNFVRTSLAKNRIKHWYKRSHKEDNISSGRELFVKELDKTKGIDKKYIDYLMNSKLLQDVANDFNPNKSNSNKSNSNNEWSADDLFAGIGFGNISVSQAVNSLKDRLKEKGEEFITKTLANEKQDFDLNLEVTLGKVVKKLNYRTADDLLIALGSRGIVDLGNRIDLNKILKIWREVQQDKTSKEDVPTDKSKSSAPENAIKGIEGIKYDIAGCCQPIPGEKIVGIIKKQGQGISIHHEKCKNVQNLLSSNRCLKNLDWNVVTDEEKKKTYPVSLQIITINRIGMMRDITSDLAEQSINISELEVKTYKADNIAVINLSIDVTDIQQFENCKESMKKIKDLKQVRRISEIKEDGE
ncbi:MAG: TGS domain-containing protein [Calothrix sp. MO_167.B12]|nr:TGS domain-containing protein [Calothrix sp. MO_167.B12]